MSGKGGWALLPVFTFLSSWLSAQRLGKALPWGWVFSGVRSFMGRFVRTCSVLPLGTLIFGRKRHIALLWTLQSQCSSISLLTYVNTTNILGMTLVKVRLGSIILHRERLSGTMSDAFSSPGHDKQEDVFQGSLVCLWIRCILEMDYKAPSWPQLYKHRFLGY